MNKKPSAKPVLYIVHGWSYQLDAWQPTIDLLAKNQVEVQLFKIPGLTKPSRKVWDVDSYVAWLEKQLKPAKRPVVLAHSNGGRLMLNFCLKHPNKIKHLILLNSAGIRPPAWQRWRHRCLRRLSKIFKPLSKYKWLRGCLYKLLRVRDYDQAKPNMRVTMKNMLASDKNLESNFHKIKTPVSMIWGKLDKITPLKQGLILKEKLADNVISFQVLPEARHSPYKYKADDLVPAILKVLEGI